MALVIATGMSKQILDVIKPLTYLITSLASVDNR